MAEDDEIELHDDQAVMVWRTLDAFRKTTNHLADVRSSLGKLRPGFAEQIDAEIRDALGHARKQLLLTLLSLVGPIWCELSDEVRESCRKAGVEIIN